MIKMNWTQVIIDKFAQKAVYLVRDDDAILEGLEMKAALIDNEVAVITYSDPVNFRFTYESEYRFNHEETLIVRLQDMDFENIPWDIYDGAFQLQIGLIDIFPFLDCRAVSEENLSVWQDIFEKSLTLYTRMGYEQSKNFISKVVYHPCSNQSDYVKEMDFSEDLQAFDAENKRFSDWGKIAYTIGRYRASFPDDNQFEEVVRVKNIEFQNFLFAEFDKSLSMVAFKQPNYVNQVAHFMARNINKSHKRQALIVIDGMSFTQWSMIENCLEQKGIRTCTTSIMAWVPTVTSVSRQAIFSGKRPSEYPQSITTTAKEASFWREFWEGNGFTSSEIKYQKSLGHKPYGLERLEFRYAGTKIYGCVIDVIDEFMHGAKQGRKTVQSEVEIWLDNGYLEMMLNELISLDYDIFLTADHGNIEATGIGKIQQGVLATSRGQRVRTYDDHTLREHTFDENLLTTMLWNSSTLPMGYLPLIARGNGAFVPKEDIIMTHGGTHIEEVLVPFVQVIKKGEEL